MTFESDIEALAPWLLESATETHVGSTPTSPTMHLSRKLPFTRTNAII